jgi:hypothetical protein
MSKQDDSEEMVTISVPLRTAQALLKSSPCSYDWPMVAAQEAARAALDARKSKYERWKESLCPGKADANLMAAAPQLLDALIEVRAKLGGDGAINLRPGVYAYDIFRETNEHAEAAIRAAVPEDVADELLGEER